MTPTIQYAPTVAIGRIVEEMVKAKSHQNSDDPATQALRYCLGIDDDKLLFRFLPLLEKAVGQIVGILHKIEITFNKDEYIKAANGLIDAFYPLNLAVSWGEYTSSYLSRNAPIHIIGACNLIGSLSERYVFPDISIEEYTDGIETLLEEIRTTDLDGFVKDYLIEELGFLKLAIEKFEYFGPDGVQMAFGNLLSACYRHEEVFEASWAGKLGKVLKVGAAVIGTVVAVDALPDIISKRSEQVMNLLTSEETKLLEYKTPSNVLMEET